MIRRLIQMLGIANQEKMFEKPTTEDAKIVALRAARDAIADTFGPWTAHDIDLGGFSTMGLELQQQWRVNYLAGLIRTFAKATIHDMSILDLGCLEGLFAIEFGRLGAHTLGIDVREAHLVKANFAKHCLKLDNVKFEKKDVRELTGDLGSFDVIICCGILYHLDFPACVELLDRMCELSTDIIIIDSHFALESNTNSMELGPLISREYEEHSYFGRLYREHYSEDSDLLKENKPWASADNEVSFFLREDDVHALLFRHGFQVMYRGFPGEKYETDHPDRPTIVARNR